jgi:putative peptidoglycan lipid II flippase
MRGSRRNPPPPRTPAEREAARAEREARRAAGRGERPPERPPGTDLPPPADDERQPADDELLPGLSRETAVANLAAQPDTTELPSGAGSTGRRARNTVIFSVLTGLSRVAGLAREIVARSLFGTSAAMSAFTLAFQVPNLIRALVADAALSSAFVPVFSDLLEHRRRREALHLASALAGLLLLALGALTVAFILIAPVLMPLFTGDEATPAIDALCVGLSQVLFPIVILLGLNGLVVGILNAHEHFTIPALAPLVWNVVIIGGLVGLRPLFDGDDQLYAYAIGVLLGTAVQLLMCLPVLRRTGYPIALSFDFRRDPRVRQVLLLMLPVSLGLGLINVSLLVNSTIGFLVSEEAPTAIDAAFRIYMLPQGMFSVAVATVLFPALSRLASRRDLAGLQQLIGSGMRQIALLLVPSAAAIVALATPIVRLVYERGDFDAESTRQVSEALFWFSFSLPVSGFTLLLTRSFFSLQRPWLPTRLALYSILVNIVVSYALHGPMGIGGVVLGTTVSNVVLTVLEARRLRLEIGGLELGRTLRSMALITAASVLLGGIAYGVWYGLDDVLGRSLPAQIVAVGTALGLGGLAYVAVLLRSGQPEARQVVDLFARRLRRTAS